MSKIMNKFDRISVVVYMAPILGRRASHWVLADGDAYIYGRSCIWRGTIGNERPFIVPSSVAIERYNSACNLKTGRFR